MSQKQPALKRTLTLPLLTFYGLGTILGAGIYVLVGKVGAIAGTYAPISFLVAGGVAGLTAYSYAKLAVLYPKSAGEAVYVFEAFRKPWLSKSIGWLVVFTGCVSAATLVKGFVGYLQVFLSVPDLAVIAVLVFILGLIAVWGIFESVMLAFVITCIEIAGLLWVMGVGWMSIDSVVVAEVATKIEPGFLGIALGAFVSFYAFIGFEDMVNVAEEVIDVKYTMPKAIGIALVLGSLFYVAVSWITVSILSPDELKYTTAPLSLVIQKAGFGSPKLIALISLVAVINGALIQIIMASRVIYGLACQGYALSFLSKVHTKFQTPIWATVGVSILIFGSAAFFPIVTLAKATSFVILCIFVFVNLSLIKLALKKKMPNSTLVLPVLGCIASILLLGVEGGHFLGIF